MALFRIRELATAYRDVWIEADTIKDADTKWRSGEPYVGIDDWEIDYPTDYYDIEKETKF